MKTTQATALTTRHPSPAMLTAVASLAKAAFDLDYAAQDGEPLESYHASLAIAVKAYTKLAGPL